jgi:hypothetical protein
MNLHLSISVGYSVEQILDVPNCLFEVYQTKPKSEMISENTPFTIIGFDFNTARTSVIEVKVAETECDLKMVYPSKTVYSIGSIKEKKTG